MFTELRQYCTLRNYITAHKPSVFNYWDLYSAVLQTSPSMCCVRVLPFVYSRMPKLSDKLLQPCRINSGQAISTQSLTRCERCAPHQMERARKSLRGPHSRKLSTGFRDHQPLANRKHITQWATIKRPF